MSGRAARVVALPIDSTDLCRFGLRGRRILYGPEIEVEQRLLFVALVLILFAQAKDFLQHFYVEALSLGLGKSSFLASFNAFSSSSICSTRSMKDKIRFPGIPTVSVMPCLAVAGAKAMAAKVAERLMRPF